MESKKRPDKDINKIQMKELQYNISSETTGDHENMENEDIFGKNKDDCDD